MHYASWASGPNFVKDMWFLPLHITCKVAKVRAEREMERHCPQGIHLNYKRDWTRAGFFPASGWHGSFLNAAHIPNQNQSKQLASTTFFLNKSALHPEHLRRVEKRYRTTEIPAGLFELVVFYLPINISLLILFFKC